MVHCYFLYAQPNFHSSYYLNKPYHLTHTFYSTKSSKSASGGVPFSKKHNLGDKVRSGINSEVSKIDVWNIENWYFAMPRELKEITNWLTLGAKNKPKHTVFCHL